MTHMIEVKPDETLDEIRGIRIIQKKNGYRFSNDSLILADFPDLTGVRMAADLGTGNGIIAILLASRSEELNIVGIEIQPSLYGLAVRNVELASLINRVRVVQRDIKSINGFIKAESFDLVVSNPPYYQIGRGRTGPNIEKTIARHEMAVSMQNIIGESSYLLKKGGRVAVIYPVVRRGEVISTMRHFNIGPRRIREIYTRDAQLILTEGEKGYPGDLKEEGPLLI